MADLGFRILVIWWDLAFKRRADQRVLEIAKRPQALSQSLRKGKCIHTV